MKKKLFSSLLSLAVTIGMYAQAPYKVIAPLPVENGSAAFLVNFDTGAKVDSAVVADGAAIFTGEIDEPIVVRILSNGSRFGTFILEQGTTAINQTTRRAVGSMLNDQLNEFSDAVNAIGMEYEEATNDADREKALDKYSNLMKETMVNNMDTPIAYLLFIDYANMIPATEMLEFIEQYPDLKEYNRVQGLMQSAQKKIATSAGQPMVDFEVTYNGETKKLSDYVGKGQYTLVDFWASWCGPCMKEMKTLKEIYNEYSDKGLQMLGVAVWDEPENSIDAIKRMQIPWDCILNSQTIATDAYGIPAIPCIILFAPDGTIVTRDVVGNELKEAVAKVMNQ